MSRTIWNKHLTVDRRIVRLLSASTYEDFPGAIREMVSNGYDADATEINIEVSLAKDRIVVSDDGNGMTPEDFDLFLRIAGRQREKNVSPVFKRERIGQFGIGFLSAFPFGKTIQISSTARKSDVRFEAVIPAEQFVREGQRVIDVGDVPIPGFEVRDAKFVREHGTQITITGLTAMARRYLESKSSKPPDRRSRRPQLHGLDRLIWRLQEDLPLDYLRSSPYRDALPDARPAGITVTLNSKRLWRNSPGTDILEHSHWHDRGVECLYLIATDWQSLAPESRGLKQRIHNVGIGDRTTFGLGLEGRAFSRLHWLTGEIRIIEGMDNLISIDRAKFIDSPEYDRFREYFRSRLAHFAYYVEDIDVVKRELGTQLSGSRLAKVEPKHEVVNRNIRKLEDRGFEVIQKTLGTSTGKVVPLPVKIDLKERTVEVYQNHPALNDVVVVAKRKLPARYITWEIDDDLPAVRRAKDGAVEINSEYPLFKSRRYGEVFKKVLALLLVTLDGRPGSHSILSSVSKQLLNEFKDLR